MRARLLTVGLLSVPLVVTGAALPSHAGSSSTQADDHGLPVPRGVTGRAALTALADDLDVAARLNRIPAAAVTRILTTDDEAHLDATGRIYYADPAPATATQTAQAQAASYPYSETFALHSLPGADRTIFLDFDGHDVSNTAWNPRTPSRFYAGMNNDGVPGFSDAEQDVIQETWQRVAEDYAPMAVDVTTEEPGDAALERADQMDREFGMRVLVTGEAEPRTALCGTCAGIAFFGSFGAWELSDPGMLQPAWAFSDRTGPNPRTIADTITHEVGHTLGLSHDGITGAAEYYEGRDQWFPIMGSSYRPLSQFSNGDYANASNQEDDYGVMSSLGAPLRADDHGGTAAGATAVDRFGTFPGVIASRADTDWFTLTHCGGPLTVDAETAPAGPDLDIQLTVRTSSGSTLATVNPLSSFGTLRLGASWSDTVAAGTYQVSVDGVGQGDPLVDGYSDYGSRGRYTIAVDTSCTAPVAPAVPQNVTLETTDNGTAATLDWDAPASTGGAPLTAYTVQRSGGSPVVLGATAGSRTFTGLTPGTAYTFAVKASNSAGTGPTATVGETTPEASTAPQILYAATPGPGSVELRWAAPLDDGGRSVSGYVVQRTGQAPVTLPANAREHTFTGLAGGSHTLTVHAVTAFGPSPADSTTWVEPGPAGPVRSLTATPTSASSLQVEWMPPVEDGERPILSYTVSIAGGQSLFLGANDTSESFHGLAADTTYQVTVRANNEFGAGAAAQASGRTWPVDHAPGPVSVYYLDATPTSVTAGWSPPAEPGGTVTGYQVRLGAGAWLAVSASTLKRTFTGLTGGRAYTVAVRAVNVHGTGIAASETLYTDPATRPSAPRIGLASSGAAGGTVTATAVWRAPLTSGGAAVSSYRVTALRLASNGSVVSRVTRTTGPGARRLVMGLRAGKYRFVVAAVNAKGTSAASARSNAVTAR